MQPLMPYIDFNSIDWRMILICFVFILLDIVSGVVKACYKNEFSSSTMRVGLMHKVATVLALIGAGACDIAVGFSDYELPFNIGIVDAFGVCIIAMELTSFLENCVAVNPDLNKIPVFKIFGVTSDESMVESNSQGTNE